MTDKEWLEHSEDWRRGYNAWAHEEDIDDYESKSDEWKKGFRYAMFTVGVGPQRKEAR